MKRIVNCEDVAKNRYYYENNNTMEYVFIDTHIAGERQFYLGLIGHRSWLNNAIECRYFSPLLFASSVEELQKKYEEYFGMRMFACGAGI